MKDEKFEERFDKHFAIGKGRKWIFTKEEAEEVKAFILAEKQESKKSGQQEQMFLLLQRFNDYEVPLQMSAQDVRNILQEELDNLD